MGKTVRSEDWFADLYRKLPIPPPDEPHIGDPGDTFLKQIAQRSRKPPLSDPRVAHVAQCPYCLRRLMELRGQPPRTGLGLSAGAMFAFAGVFLAIVFVFGWRLHTSSARQEELSSVQTLDLSTSSTTRGGEAKQVPVIRLPRKQDKLTLLLPLFSEQGQYSVQVLADQSQPEAVAIAHGTAAQAGKTTTLKVMLDLSNAKPGIYYLATTHESDEAAYYYPIAVAD